MMLPPVPSLASSNDWLYTIEQYGKECAKKALEQAAQACDELAAKAAMATKSPMRTGMGKTLAEGQWGGATNCASAIRALMED